jgi:hypothetical protein
MALPGIERWGHTNNSFLPQSQYSLDMISMSCAATYYCAVFFVFGTVRRVVKGAKIGDALAEL